MGRTITNIFFLMILAGILISTGSIITESLETSITEGITDRVGYTSASNTSDQTTANTGTIDKITNVPVIDGSAAMGDDDIDIVDPAYKEEVMEDNEGEIMEDNSGEVMEDNSGEVMEDNSGEVMEDNSGEVMKDNGGEVMKTIRWKR